VNGCPGCQQRELILWFAAGTLTGEEAALAENAVHSCRECQAAYLLDRSLGESLRAESAELPPEELEKLAASSRQDLWHLSARDREIIGILREVDPGDLRRASWTVKLLSLRDRALSMNPAWAYVIALLLIYPAYLGLQRYPRSEPRVLPSPVALGEPATRAPGETRLVRAGSDSVISIFVPVDPSYRYSIEIRDPSGQVQYRMEDASPFDGIGTFAVLLPAGTLDRGRYDILVEEAERSGPRPLNVYSFPFTIERD
jgi:hypothetical protein